MFHLLFVLLVSIILEIDGESTIKTYGLEIKFNITSENHCQEDTNRIQIYYDGSLSDCVTECALRLHCKALDYHTKMTFCQLFTKSDKRFTRNNCMFTRKEDIVIKKLPCGSRCGFGESCDIDSKECLVKECMEFPEIKNGKILGNHKTVGSKIIVRCQNKSKPKNGIKQSYCTPNRAWNPIVQCESDCGELPIPENAVVEQSNGTTEGSYIVYACRPGFIVVNGSLNRVCQANGLWDGLKPQCNLSCDELPIPANAIIVENNRTTEGSYIQYNCIDGFGAVFGSMRRTCDHNGEWTGTEPECMKKVCSSMFCYAKYSLKDIEYGDKQSFYGTFFLEECISKCESFDTKINIIRYMYVTYYTNHCICKQTSFFQTSVIKDSDHGELLLKLP